ncbi:translation initiation factor IF-2-like [Panicum virgatum]|uniref:translation initiation factor IF-2-like n=1 Tax=Panicum virgatum TaxID=38727 RepID=UPI0019D600BF|nr:translation initiation factor IF-2-like [Panicum virgatum]
MKVASGGVVGAGGCGRKLELACAALSLPSIQAAAPALHVLFQIGKKLQLEPCLHALKITIHTHQLCKGAALCEGAPLAELTAPLRAGSSSGFDGRELASRRRTRAAGGVARRQAGPARGRPCPGARLPQHAVAGPRLPRREAALAGGGPCPGAPLSQFATAPARREAVPAAGGPRLEPRGATGGNRRREERSGRRLAACCKEGRQRPQLSAAATRRSPSSSLAASLGRDLDGSPVACSPARAGAAPPPRAGLGRWEAARLHQRALGLAASRGGRSVLSRISGHGGGRLCSRRRPDVQASAGANGSTGLGVLRPVSKKGKYVFLHLRQPP